MLKNGIEKIEAVICAADMGWCPFEQVFFHQARKGRLQLRHLPPCSGLEMANLKAFAKSQAIHQKLEGHLITMDL